MRFKPIITEFDDQDCYKYFMQFGILKHYPNAKVKYKFILRDKTRKFPKGFATELKEQVAHFKNLKFTKEIEEHLKSKLPFFDISYYMYLRSYEYDPNEVKISQKSGALEIEIEGYWHKTIFWEVQLMALISELFFLFSGEEVDLEKSMEIWDKKFKQISELGITLSEFGTRRRFSKFIQGKVIEEFLKVAPKTIVGTSNVMFARKYNIKAIGTQAHEWFMFHAAKYGVMMANRVGMGRWVDAYKGALGIALSDTYTTDVFFEGFDLFYSKLFDGVRQDSGDPIKFTEKTITHYTKKGIIMPNGFIPKTIVFSDAINSIEKIKSIEDSVRGKILSSYGIGTWMSNDVVLVQKNGLYDDDYRNQFNWEVSEDPVGGYFMETLKKAKPLNMVIKMSEALPEGMVNWRDCVKLSDSEGKYTGNFNTVKLYKEELGI